MPLEAITGTNLAEVAYERIRESMFAGVLVPGSRLVMDDLAVQLGVSRTPVRDALRRLESEGFVEQAGRRGFIASKLDPQFARNIYESRMAIEGFAARLAAAYGKDASRQVDVAIEEAGKLEPQTQHGSYEANRLVHRALVLATQNTLLVELFDHLWDQGKAHHLYENCFRSGSNGRSELRLKHQLIVDGLASEDPDLAQAAVMSHLRAGWEALSSPSDK